MGKQLYIAPLLIGASVQSKYGTTKGKIVTLAIMPSGTIHATILTADGGLFEYRLTELKVETGVRS